MKKLFVTLACLASLSFSSKAQMSFAPAAGLNISNFGGDMEGTSTLMGAHLGVLMNMPLGDRLAFQPGLLYSMKGAKYDFDLGPLGSLEVEQKLNYLEIPLNLVFSLGEDHTGFQINAGPYIGYLLSAKVGDESGTEGMNKLDYGANVGLGYKLPMGLFFRAQGGFGFANLSDEEGSDVKITNSPVIGVTVGYFLGGNN